MKAEILDRIKQLGGEISDLKGISLQEDLQAIVFDTVLYPKPINTAWVNEDDQEPIYGISELITENQNLLTSNTDEFYQKIIDHYYKITEEGFGQIFFKNELFTPFKEGTATYQEWNGEWEENDFKKTINGSDMELMLIGYSYGFPDNLFICLTDPNPENPMVYGTDHEVFFDEITKEGTLEEYFNAFLTKEELIEIVRKKLEHQ